MKKLLDQLDAIAKQAEPAAPARPAQRRAGRREPEPEDFDEDDPEPTPRGRRLSGHELAASVDARMRLEGDDEIDDATWAAAMRKARQRGRVDTERYQVEQVAAGVQTAREVARRNREALRAAQAKADARGEELEPESDMDEQPEQPRPARAAPLVLTPAPEPRAGYMPASKTVDHCTPAVIVSALLRMWPEGIDLDPSASDSGQQILVARRMLSLGAGDDGLTHDWLGERELLGIVDRPLRIYNNCPYGKEIADWVAKMDRTCCGSGYEAEGVMLLPTRSDTSWFKLLLERAAAICYVQGRLKFVGSKDSAPFPCVLPLFADEETTIRAFEKAFGEDLVMGSGDKRRPIGTVRRRKRGLSEFSLEELRAELARRG